MFHDRRQCAAIGAAFGISVGIALSPSAAQAQFPRLNYSQAKTLEVKPPAAPAGNPTVSATHYEHAWYINTNQLIPLDIFAVANPAAQTDPNYSLFNYDWRDNFAKKRTITNIGAVPDNNGAFPKGAAKAIVDEASVNAPINANTKFEVKANPLNDRADASVTFQAAPAPAANANYVAKYKVEGSVTKEPGVVGYAFSEASMQYTDIAAVMKKIKVGTTVSSNIGRLGSGIKNQSRTFDPLSFSLLDSGGTSLFSDDILSTFTATSDDAQIDWLDTGSIELQTGASGLAGVHIGINPNYVLAGESGNLDFEITDGKVTQSNATGAFAGIVLPSIGAFLSDFTFNIGSAGLTVDLDLDNIVLANPGTTSITLISDQGALVSVTAPEPGSLAMMAAGALSIGSGLLLRRRRLAG